MSLIRCPECGKEVSDQASACIHCGYPFAAAPPPSPAPVHQAPPTVAAPPPLPPGQTLSLPLPRRGFLIGVGVLALILFLLVIVRASFGVALWRTVLASALWVGLGVFAVWGAGKFLGSGSRMGRLAPYGVLVLAFLTMGMFVPDERSAGGSGGPARGLLPGKPQVDHRAVARRYAEKTGRQIMDHIGGGQDLIVDVLALEFDERQENYVIEMRVSFNGSFVRANNYQVTGRLTVMLDGTSPRFARREVNQLYREQEALKGTFQILEALSEEASKSRNTR